MLAGWIFVIHLEAGDTLGLDYNYLCARKPSEAQNSQLCIASNNLTSVLWVTDSFLSFIMRVLQQ